MQRDVKIKISALKSISKYNTVSVGHRVRIPSA